MKVFFVGVHNKADMSPLSSKSKSGKLIDMIIELLPGLECCKCNLYDIERFPEQKEKSFLKLDFLTRIDYTTKDVVVLLGAIVHKECPQMSVKEIIKMPHPSKVWSHVAQQEYVKRAVRLISKNIEPDEEN